MTTESIGQVQSSAMRNGTTGQAMNQSEADLIKGRTMQLADTALRQELRQALDPIRRDLLMKYPDCAALLDPDTWPENRRQS